MLSQRQPRKKSPHTITITTSQEFWNANPAVRPSVGRSTGGREGTNRRNGLRQTVLKRTQGQDKLNSVNNICQWNQEKNPRQFFFAMVHSKPLLQDSGRRGGRPPTPSTKTMDSLHKNSSTFRQRCLVKCLVDFPDYLATFFSELQEFDWIFHHPTNTIIKKSLACQDNLEQLSVAFDLDVKVYEISIL